MKNVLVIALIAISAAVVYLLFFWKAPEQEGVAQRGGTNFGKAGQIGLNIQPGLFVNLNDAKHQNIWAALASAQPKVGV